MQRAPSRPILVGVLALVAVLFVAHELASRNAFDASLEHMDSIIDNALPSIVDLVEARRALSDVRSELARDHAYTTPERRRALARDVDERWKVIHERFGQYQRFPTFPGEPALQARVDDDLARLRTSIDRALAAPSQ